MRARARCYRVTHPGTLHPVRVRYKPEERIYPSTSCTASIFSDFSIRHTRTLILASRVKSDFRRPAATSPCLLEFARSCSFLMISGHGPITKNSELSLARGIAGSAESAIACLHHLRSYTLSGRITRSKCLSVLSRYLIFLWENRVKPRSISIKTKGSFLLFLKCRIQYENYVTYNTVIIDQHDTLSDSLNFFSVPIDRVNRHVNFHARTGQFFIASTYLINRGEISAASFSQFGSHGT